MSTVPVAEGDAGLRDLLGRAAGGDVDARGAVYDATSGCAWKVAVVTVGSAEGAASALRAAYAEVWSEARTFLDDAELVRGPRAWILGRVYLAAAALRPV